MNTNLNNYKERAKRLRNSISSVLNVECSQSQAYELIAKEENYPNWDALSGTINKNKVESCSLTKQEQLVQLFLIYEGLSNCYPLSSILSFLKEQKNPVIKKGWSKVEMPSDSTKFFEIFEQTNLFSDDVLSILKISTLTNELASAIKSSIEFLKIS